MPRLILALALLLPQLALAQSPEQIAQEALQLYKAGRYAEAAARFLESFAFSAGRPSSTTPQRLMRRRAALEMRWMSGSAT